MSTGHLVFENGVVMQGRSLGKTGQATGKVMPYTSMTDYQAILCDPVTQGQLICMTYPLIGNVGRIDNLQDAGNIQAAGLILRESIDQVDHWQSVESLHDWLLSQNSVAICGIDTREVVRLIRDRGPMYAVISTQPDADVSSLADQARRLRLTPDAADQTAAGTQDAASQQVYMPAQVASEDMSQIAAGCHAAAIDLGLNQKLINALTARGCKVTVQSLPASPAHITKTQADQTERLLLELKPDVIVLTSGPEEQAGKASGALLSMIRRLADQLPVWGVDSGHLLLARSFGLPLISLPLGHHGANYPVFETSSGRTYMTLQHHRLTVAPQALENQKTISLTHRNINDDSIEGLSYGGRHFSTQFLPDTDNYAHQTGHIWDQLIAALS